MLRREIFRKRRQKWKMLVFKAKEIRFIGIYASPSATKKEWYELEYFIRRIRRLPGRSVVYEDLSVRHKYGKIARKCREGDVSSSILSMKDPLLLPSFTSERPMILLDKDTTQTEKYRPHASESSSHPQGGKTGQERQES